MGPNQRIKPIQIFDAVIYLASVAAVLCAGSPRCLSYGEPLNKTASTESSDHLSRLRAKGLRPHPVSFSLITKRND